MNPLEKKQVAFMVHYLKDQRFKLMILLLLMTGNLFLQLYNPRFIQSFIDRARAGEEHAVLTAIAALFLLLSLLRQAVAVAVQYVTSDIMWKATNRLRHDLAKRCLAYDLTFHSSHSPGEMTDRIDGDIGRLNNFLSAFALKTFSNMLLVIGALTVICWIHPVVGAAVAAAVLLGLFVLTKLSRYGSDNIRRYLGEVAGYIGFMDERIAGREDIRAFGAGRHVLNRFYAILGRLYGIRKQTGRRIATVVNTGELVQAAIIVSAVVPMGLLYMRGEGLSMGTMFLVYFYITIILVPLRNMVTEVSDLQHVHASWARIQELMNDRRKVEDEGSCELAGDSWSVRFDNVSFRYTEDSRVLHQVSFDIPAGKKVGIIGRTGSGKTTVARLLYRLCDAQEGTISVNGVNSKHIKLDSLRAGIAAVSQHVELFEGTLRDNLTMFREGIADSRIWEALDELSLGDWVRGMPEVLDRSIERDGRNLSAGEAQLVAFARVFLKQPKIVIMDEATSKVDPATEKLIERAVARLTGPCTTIVIAHKLQTVRQMDYIIVMEGGTVAEFGDTSKLAADAESAYARMIGGVEQSA